MPMGVPMSAISADIAQGGDDDTVLAYRYGPYYAKIVRKPGHTTPDGSSIAGLVASHRRYACKVVLDMTGGYGGAAYEVLRRNGIECIGFKGYDGMDRGHHQAGGELGVGAGRPRRQGRGAHRQSGRG